MNNTKEGADKLRSLHYRAVKSAQAYEAATPGTQTKRIKEAAWERAEAAFNKALDTTFHISVRRGMMLKPKEASTDDRC